jgi:DNA-binding IclR family transcriptional regulator
VTRGVQTIERAAAIMRLLAESDQPLALAQIAGSLGLAKPTAHGLLKTLWQVGFVVKDPVNSRYGPASNFLDITGSPIDPNRLRGSALNFADSLASRTGESVRVGVLEGYLVRVVHHVFAPGRGSDRLDVDATYLAHVAPGQSPPRLPRRYGDECRRGRPRLQHPAHPGRHPGSGARAASRQDAGLGQR